MMKKTLIITAIIATMAVGCKKYDDGPVVSLVPKANRLDNTWEVDKAYDEGKEVTGSYNQYTLKLTKDGGASLTAKYSYGPFIYEGTTNGTWVFKNSKEDIMLDFEDNDADATYEILRLTSNELWLKEKAGTVELHLDTK